jgi:hypothetical protein
MAGCLAHEWLVASHLDGESSRKKEEDVMRKSEVARVLLANLTTANLTKAYSNPT